MLEISFKVSNDVTMKRSSLARPEGDILYISVERLNSVLHHKALKTNFVNITLNIFAIFSLEFEIDTTKVGSGFVGKT